MTSTTTSRQEYVEQMQKKLDEWNRELDTLEGRISATTGAARESLRDQLEKARHGFAAGQQKLEQIQEASESSWDKMQEEAEHLWETLKHSINYFRSQV